MLKDNPELTMSGRDMRHFVTSHRNDETGKLMEIVGRSNIWEVFQCTYMYTCTSIDKLHVVAWVLVNKSMIVPKTDIKVN